MASTFDPRPVLRQVDLTLPDLRPVHWRHTNQHREGSSAHTVRDAQRAEALGVSDRTVQRWLHGGRLTARTADRVAAALGLHPALLWPEWYDQPAPTLDLPSTGGCHATGDM
jgi:transcriptional regulator with XRE-family HTH domain